MSGRINFQLQLFLGLVLALSLGWLYQFPQPATDPLITPTPSPAPVFQNLSGGWLLQVRFFQAKLPEVVALTPLELLRLSPKNPQGKYFIQILDVNSQELFIEKFDVYFLRTGSSEILNSVEQSLLIPALDGAVKVIIHSPQGEISHAFP